MNKNKIFSGKESIQEFFFKSSLVEIGKEFTQNDIKIDHLNGKNFYKGEEFNLIFPKFLISHIDKISKIKKIDYCFIGKISKNRDWVNEFSSKGIIKNSLSGRNPNLKYIIDEEYYSTLSSSKFTLSPVGDCPWSYRFFESILCKSIPIVDLDTDDVYRKYFKFYGKNETHVYNQEFIEYNYNSLITNFTLKPNI